MRCKIRFEEISLYLDEKLLGKKKEALEKHLPRCEACSKELDRLSHLRASLRRLTPIKESEGFDFAFHRKLDEAIERNSKARVIDIWKENIGTVICNIKDSAFPIPAAVRVAASFMILFSLFLGARAQSAQRIPIVEFVAGEVSIYKPSQAKWVLAEKDMRLRAGEKIKLGNGSMINIASTNKYKARIKDDSLIVISKLSAGMRNIDTGFDIAHGNLLVNTSKAFKGSKMHISTPSCDAEVVGTAFMVKVDSKETWLGVLEGKVKVISKTGSQEGKVKKEIATYVSSGQRVDIKLLGMPTVPELFSEKEWENIQELYQLAEARKIMLLIGTGSNRIDDLLKPAPMHIPTFRRSFIPKPIQDTIDTIIDATEQGNAEIVYKASRRLEKLLGQHPNRAYDVEILMFVASHYHYAGNYDDALRVFGKVIKDYPDSQLASLAQCAIAIIYQKNLKNMNRAEKTYKQLLQNYPDSVDAIKAQEGLISLR